MTTIAVALSDWTSTFSERTEVSVESIRAADAGTTPGSSSNAHSEEKFIT